MHASRKAPVPFRDSAPCGKAGSANGRARFQRVAKSTDRWRPRAIVFNSSTSAIAKLRAAYGPIPAVLATADRTQELRETAHEADIAVLNKPLKPAALRALLAQWRALCQAAE